MSRDCHHPEIQNSAVKGHGGQKNLRRWWIVLVQSLLLVGLAVGCAQRNLKKPQDPVGRTDLDDIIAEGTEPGGDQVGGESAGGGVQDPGPDQVPETQKQVVPENYKNLVNAKRLGSDNLIKKYASEILAKNPKDIKTLNFVAMYHYENKNHSLARFILGQALKMAPDSPTLHNNLALVLEAEGKKRESIFYLKKSLDLNPDHVPASGNLGSYYVAYRDYERSLPLLESAFRANPKDKDIANNLAMAYRGIGRYDQAKSIYEKAMRWGGRDTSILYNYAVLLIEFLSEPREGLKLVHKIRFIGSDDGLGPRLNELEKKATSAIK